MDLDDEELKATKRLNGSDKNINIMGEDLKDIELFIDFCRAPYNFEHESEEKSYKELSNKIEHLIKAYKELEEFKKQVTEIENTNFIKYKNYIPISLVEEKIEERKLWLSSNDIGYKDDYVLEVLQELLEKR